MSRKDVKKILVTAEVAPAVGVTCPEENERTVRDNSKERKRSAEGREGLLEEEEKAII